jgi:hypothetical protein
MISGHAAGREKGSSPGLITRLEHHTGAPSTPLPKARPQRGLGAWRLLWLVDREGVDRYDVGYVVDCRKVEAWGAGEHRGDAECAALAGINVELSDELAPWGRSANKSYD